MLIPEILENRSGRCEDKRLILAVEVLTLSCLAAWPNLTSIPRLLICVCLENAHFLLCWPRFLTAWGAFLGIPRSLDRASIKGLQTMNEATSSAVICHQYMIKWKLSRIDPPCGLGTKGTICSGNGWDELIPYLFSDVLRPWSSLVTLLRVFGCLCGWCRSHTN